MREGGEYGFTLLEAIVSVAVLALVVVTAQRGFASGARALRLADQEDRAAALAQSQLASAGQETLLADGANTSGRHGMFEWRTTVSAYRDPRNIHDPVKRRKLYQVSSTVTWRAGALTRPRQVQLTTLKLSEVAE